MKGKTPSIAIKGTDFTIDGEPFYFQGVSFFNAIYNKEFNKSGSERKRWIRKFRETGITVLRIMANWDWPEEGHIDISTEHRLWKEDGRLNEEHADRLVNIILDAADLGMAVQLCMFSEQSRREYPTSFEHRDEALKQVTRAFMPYRNLIFQIWNEFTLDVEEHYRAIKSIDPDRLVSNSPGWPNVIGDDAQNRLLDFLTPHTVRVSVGDWWVEATKQIDWLIRTYRKPVVDDEPARTGTANFGGIEGGTTPEEHILHIRAIRQVGGHHTYHHDMFQLGYGDPSIPPTGIPDPEFSPFHSQVFRFLKIAEAYFCGQ